MNDDRHVKLGRAGVSRRRHREDDVPVLALCDRNAAFARGETAAKSPAASAPAAESRTKAACLIAVKHLAPEAATDEAKSQALSQA